MGKFSNLYLATCKNNQWKRTERIKENMWIGDKIQTQWYGAILSLRFTSVEFVLRTAELIYAAAGKCELFVYHIPFYLLSQINQC